MRLSLLVFVAAFASGALELHETILTAGPHADIMVAADLNHDSRPDLVVGDSEDGTVTILLNEGGGRFHAAPGSPFHCGSQPNDFAVADFNRDGHPDLAIVNTQTPFISILLGDGHGGFALGSFFNVGKRPYQRLRSADLNGDGKADVVTTNLDGDSVTVLLGDGRGGFREAPGSPFQTAPAPWAIDIADVNRDGKPDLIVIPYDRDAKSRGGDANVTVLIGDGSGRFAPLAGSPFSLHSCAQPTAVAAGDLTRGPLLDIAVTCVNSSAVAFLTPETHGYRVEMRSLPGRPYGLAVADFFGSGRMSLAVSESATGTVRLLRP